MTKNVIIGIGGTGLSAIRELRRLMAERYEEGLKDPNVRSTRFLYIDTDREDAGRRSWTVLGKDISLQASEMAMITGDQLTPLVQRPSDYPDIDPWLPEIKNYVGAPGPGAKGIRPYGRLIYEYGPNKQLIKDRLLATIQDLDSQHVQLQERRYYIVGSISGGTGSGMLLPFAQDLIKWDIFGLDKANEKLRGFLVMPPLAISGRHDRYHANAYASLRELNYHGARGTLPFNNLYLVEPINANDITIGLENLPLLIAQRLFLNIQQGEAARYIDGLMDNPNLGTLEDGDPRRRHAMCFSSFGLSSLSYPREKIARGVGMSWGAAMVANWLSEREAPKGVNQAVRNDLPKLKLSRLHTNGDGDPFGNQDFPPYETQLPQLAEGRIDPLEKRQLGDNANKMREELETTFRGAGIDKFYQQREKDARRAADYAIRQVRLSVSRQVRDPERGIRFAKEYLDELAKILDLESKAEASERFGSGAEQRVAMCLQNYAESVNTTSHHEQKMVYWDSEFSRDKANVREDLKAYLTRLAGYWSAKYAITMLDYTIPAVKALRAQMDVWHQHVAETLQKMEGRVKMALAGRTQDPKENGTVIFDEEMLKTVAAQAPPAVVNPAMEERLRRWLAATLQQDMEDLDLFALMDQPDPDEAIAAIAFEYILSDDSPLQVRKATLYDQFLTKFPRPEQRQEALKRTRAQAEVFTRWLPEEVGRKPVPTVTAAAVSLPDDPKNQKAMQTVREDLVGAGVPGTQIQATQDVERIIFVQETLAFPLRFIASVRRLKDYYDAFPYKDALHIDRREIGDLYELFLLSDADRKAVELAEETILLARANGWMRQEQNQQTLQSEVRYEYDQPGKIGKKTTSFGPDWETAFDRFTQDALVPEGQASPLREGRNALTEYVNKMRETWRTEPQLWQKQFATLDTFLEGTLSQYRARTDDRRYKRDAEIINRIVGKSQFVEKQKA